MAIQVEIGRTRNGLHGLARKMYGAIVRFLKAGAERIDLKRTDAASFAGDRQAAVDAEDFFQAARLDRSNCIGARRGLEVESDRFIGRCKKLLSERPEFGTRWNLTWVQIGFKTPGTIETPVDNDDKLEVLRCLGRCRAFPSSISPRSSTSSSWFVPGERLSRCRRRQR